MSTPVAALSMRPATSADARFILQLFATTRADELAHLPMSDDHKQAFVRQQSALQEQQYREMYPDASFEIIELDGESIGRRYIDRSTAAIRLIDIALVPDMRGRGFGTALISALLDEAADTGRRVRLHVTVTNPAARLYGRLGFDDIGGDDLNREYEWAPQGERG